MRHLLTVTTALFTASLALAQTPPAPPAPPAAAAPPMAPAAPAAPTPPAAPAAPAAPAVAAVPAPPPPPPLPSDARERIEAVCMAEARTKAKAAGISEVNLKEVQDTDVKSDGFASMRAKVELVRVDSKGKTKRKKGTFGCSARNDVVTNFSFD
jgi:hypothetical protein